MEWLALLLLGLQGYFTIFLLTPRTKRIGNVVTSVKTHFDSSNDSLDKAVNVIFALDRRLSQMETEIRLRASDSSRIIEWLDKRDKALVEFQEKIQKSLHIEEREKRLDHHQSEIIQLGKEIRLIREKK